MLDVAPMKQTSSAHVERDVKQDLGLGAGGLERQICSCCLGFHSIAELAFCPGLKSLSAADSPPSPADSSPFPRRPGREQNEHG